jgi:hypothetical protein
VTSAPSSTRSSRAWTGASVTCSGTRSGGQACAIHLARAGRGRGRLILVAVGLPWYRSYAGPPARRAVLHPVDRRRDRVLRVWPGWGFGGRQARGVIRDWGYTARHGRFPRSTAPRSTCRRYGLRCSRSASLTIVTRRPPTLDHLLRTALSAPIERVHLTDPLDHFSWVRSPEAVAARVVEFVS